MYLNQYRAEGAEFAYASGHSGDTTINGDGQNDALNNSVGNALKHAYFSARVALAYGQDFALSFTNAHEFKAQQNNWSPTESVMDKFNNVAGIRVAKDIVNAGTPESAHVGEIKRRLLDLSALGKLYVVRRDNLVAMWSTWKPID